MPSTSIVSGFTYINYGPATTTFEPPASCATDPTRTQVGPSHSSYPLYQWGLECETAGGWECMPSVTIDTSTTFDTSPTQFFKGYYYSPGLYCPSDWATVGAVTRGDGDKLTTTGILAPSGTDVGRLSLRMNRELFFSILDKSETAVLCCPSSYTADIDYGCWSTVKDYKPSSACNWEVPSSDIGSSTIKTTVNGTSTKVYLQTLGATSKFIGPTTTTFDSDDKKTIAGYAREPLITMIHKKSDLDNAGDTTKNAAARVVHGSSSWSGAGPVFGICVAAMVLGAAIVL